MAYHFHAWAHKLTLAAAGALTAIFTGNSTARTPVDDPQRAIIPFLLMGLGTSAGRGPSALCALGMVLLAGIDGWPNFPMELVAAEGKAGCGR